MGRKRQLIFPIRAGSEQAGLSPDGMGLKRNDRGTQLSIQSHGV